MCSLPANGQTPTVSQTAIAAYVHQAFDVHRYLGTKGTLDLVSIFDNPTEFIDLFVRQILYTNVRINGRVGKDRLGR